MVSFSEQLCCTEYILMGIAKDKHMSVEACQYFPSLALTHMCYAADHMLIM